MAPAENTYNLKPGTKITFTPTGATFEIAKVTNKNVSWYTGFDHKGGCGINNLKMTTQGLARTNKGIAEGTYIIK